MGNATINTITIFAVTTATRRGILKGEKRSDVIVIVVHCEQVSGGTGASVTTSRAGAKAINNSAIAGTCTACGDITTTKGGCKPFSGCDAAASVGTISNHIYLSRGTCTSSMSRWRDARCINIHIDSGVRGCGAKGRALRCMCSAVHEAFSR
jgi:hypothetical protein